MKRLDETTQRVSLIGDNWHTTWADNDRQYVSLCDGSGGPAILGNTGKAYNTRVLELDGDPSTPVFRHLPGFPDLETEPGTSRIHRYYGFGIIAIDGTIYHFLSTPNHTFVEPDARFIGAKLIYSPDNGQTWRNADGSPARWEEREDRTSVNMVFFHEPDESFSLLTCLQMGRNYEHNQDGYVYIYAPNGNRDGTMNQLVMLRTPKEQILNRSAYEFFVSHADNGKVVWSRDITKRGVVHTFPSGWVNTQLHPYAWHPSVVFNAPLGVYMMANWGMASDAHGMWFDKPSYLGFWVSEQPWGPWKQVHEETSWTPLGDPGARAYQPQILPKWIAEDGKSFWLVWTDFQQLDERLPYYCFNYQKVELLLE
jgi:hypothetical protein